MLTVSPLSVLVLTRRLFGVSDRNCAHSLFVSIARRSISPPFIQRVITHSSLDGLLVRRRRRAGLPARSWGELGIKNHFADIGLSLFPEITFAKRARLTSRPSVSAPGACR